MSRKPPLSDENIIAFLNDLADSEDGLNFDDDSIADPDFIPELYLMSFIQFPRVTNH